MRRDPKESLSVWQRTEQWPALPTLEGTQRADICIVGAGISGLSIAYHLLKEGKSVIVVDAWEVGSGETGRTTAHLSSVLDDGFHHLESLFGERDTRLAVGSHMAAINRIEQIVQREGIDCSFERLNGYLVALGHDAAGKFEQERQAAARLGLTDMEVLDRVPLAGMHFAAPTMQFPMQATFDMDRYLRGLTEAVLRMGGKIFIHSPIRSVRGGKQAHVIADNGARVNANNIVIATHTPINDWVKMHTKQYAYRSYVIAYEVPRGTYQSFLLWDMNDPYHYVRTLREPGRDLLIIGGEDHKTGQANDPLTRYEKLEQWAGQHFDTLGNVVCRWSGQIMEPADGLAFIGRNPLDADNVFIVTGDSGHGITHGTIAGMLITDLIMDQKNPWEEIYTPSRKHLKAAPTFLKENANFVGCMVSDWVKASEVENRENILPGQAAIMRDGIGKLAIYRDEEGVLHECSAICTHLGCIVQWNAGEKTWDCPCHGSRFSTEGAVLNGPAIQPLKAKEPAAEKEPKRRHA